MACPQSRTRSNHYYTKSCFFQALIYKDELAGILATKKDIHAIRADIVNHDKKFEEITETLANLLTREEIQNMMDRAFDVATLKAEHERIKQIIREHHKVEV